MPKYEQINKVLVIGSGPVVIGQAAEFDYAGTQACLALKEEEMEVVLVNNNPATIMTDEKIADRVYLEPLTCESIEKIIEFERPDGLLPTLGGQTGLNLAVSLSESNILERYNVQLLGTPLDTIQKGEDRELFKAMMKEIQEPVAESISTTSIEEAAQFATKMNYPIIVRPAYTLGGAGGGIANNTEELIRIAKTGIHASPINQILVEQSVKGWKEIEYEVMRDANDTCIIICNMENIDPVGVHTGDSIVVAPSQTLNDYQYQMLRNVSCKVIRALGVIGGCNIQFALHPETNEYVIIEVNPRVSRSSALASKATGYPIARIAAKLALGYHLDEIYNPITKEQFASFEPTMDYLAVKIPRWPFDKFKHANTLLGTQMMATGEVMALARNFPAALQKAIRSLEAGVGDLDLPSLANVTNKELENKLIYPTDDRLFAIAEALRRGYSIETLYELTNITKYFLIEMKQLIQVEQELKHTDWGAVTKEMLLNAKVYGYSNQTLAKLFHQQEETIENKLKELQLKPAYKMVDTCAGEFEAKTPYFYSTWKEYNEVPPLTKEHKIVVLGSGPIRIGQGIEFDYCSVQAALSLKEQNYETIVINNNPETVSTDIHIADHLFFEPLTLEDVVNVIETEEATGVIVQFGGQTAIHLADGLAEKGIPVLGTTTDAIEMTENRERFYNLLQKLNIPHIPGETITNVQQLKAAVNTLGFPILLRPSYVIGGSGMVVIRNDQELNDYVGEIVDLDEQDKMFPILVDSFIQGMEVEVDAVCDGEDIIIPGVFQHVEHAGIHSGDSMAIFPAPNLTLKQKQLITEYTKKISKKMNAKGALNIQFVIKEEDQSLYVLEVNPRASRTVPIVSKITGVPLVNLATKVQMGKSLKTLGYELGLHQEMPYYAVKAPVFSTNKLKDVDPLLGPEMKSTGEVIGLGMSLQSAMKKAFHWKEQTEQLEQKPNVFLSPSRADLTHIHQLKDVLNDITTFSTKPGATLLAETGIIIDHIITIDEAIQLCTDNILQILYTSVETKGVEKWQNLRETALKMHTACFSSLQSLLAYLSVMHHDMEVPKSIQDYVLMTENLNRQKERVTK
ncbi:carbamoyl-phosphate synthase (glutamine-hydrolyzing) large subunit [Salirhabdus sp. Marseille-P4669]|uniref:carbamoyl-phosphate synthase (glutamine-hydrolyzing) large subunit n=1 Tax=Salirhabdus sp. Marseille-P4669 TaxID=2042310 RepID=UPI000C7C8F81|nr:carbamoyl-phosphate synthase (glutamine-hydrolyzing) large subunit [Salirhabdus sp. Marseille-P4669]